MILGSMLCSKAGIERDQMPMGPHYFGELSRRGVFGTAAIYIVAGWVAVQVASEIFPAFNIPDTAIRFVWMGVMLGFPLAVVVGWMYDISRQGITRTSSVHSGGKGKPLGRFDYLFLAGIAAVCLAIIFSMTGEIVKLRQPASPFVIERPVIPNSLAVLPLDNFTGDPEQEYLVAGLHEALTAGLTGIRALKLLSGVRKPSRKSAGNWVFQISSKDLCFGVVTA
jgi:hypothetical protein